MRLAIAALALLASACGGAPSVCGPFNAGFALNCDVADHDLSLARSMIVSRNLGTDAELDQVVAKTYFYVRPDLNWDVEGVTACGTFTVPYGLPQATLNRRGLALLHELLHGLAYIRGEDYLTHAEWDTNGKQGADDDFGSAYTPWGPLVML